MYPGSKFKISLLFFKPGYVSEIWKTLIFNLNLMIAGEYIQRRFPSPVPSRTTDQAAPTGIHYSDTALDIRAEFQSLTLCVPSHRDAILHLRHHRDAGLFFYFGHSHCHLFPVNL